MTYSLLAAIGDATKSFATDLIGSSIFTRTKVTFGVEGSATDVSATNPLPTAIIGSLGPVTLGAGSAAIGTVSVTGSVAVVGTFFQTTQPVSIASPVAVTGTFFQATQPISAAALPLPTGAATSANQATGNTSLASIDGKLPALSGGVLPVVDSALATLLGTPATELPPTPLLVSSGLTHVKIDVTSATTTAVVTAVAGQTVRIHDIDLQIDSDASGHINVDICSNTTVLRRYRWTAGQGRDTGFQSRPIFKSATGETINIITSGTQGLKGRISYVQSV